MTETPLADARLADAEALLARLDAVPSISYLTDNPETLSPIRPLLRDLISGVHGLRAEVRRLERELADTLSERDELRKRIRNARDEVIRQDSAATLAMRPGYCAVSDALAAVETHLVDPQYRPTVAPQPAQDGPSAAPGASVGGPAGTESDSGGSGAQEPAEAAESPMDWCSICGGLIHPDPTPGIGICQCTDEDRQAERDAEGGVR